MKRNQKKETKSRRPLKRFIALWIVFAMLVVPFANHVGKDDAKVIRKNTLLSKMGRLYIEEIKKYLHIS